MSDKYPVSFRIEKIVGIPHDLWARYVPPGLLRVATLPILFVMTIPLMLLLVIPMLVAAFWDLCNDNF